MVTEKAGVLEMIPNVKFAFDLSICFALGKGDRPLFVTSNRYVPVKINWTEVQLRYVLVGRCSYLL